MSYEAGMWLEVIDKDGSNSRTLYGELVIICYVDKYDSELSYQVERVNMPGHAYWVKNSNVDRTIRAIVEQTVAENKTDTDGTE